jgi:O-antigen/teichoic acid export membrane protein
MIISTYLANIIVGGFILINVRKYITFKPNRSWAKTLSKYSIFMVFADVSFIIHTNIDKIFINKYLIIADVGLYNAYYYASINVITILMGIFIATLFPIICKSQNKKIIFENINKLLPIIIIVGLPLIIISQHIIIRIYGDEYIIRTSLIMLFAITSVIIAFFRLYTWTFNSVGIEGAKLNLLGNGTIAIVNILLNIYLIPHFGLEGAISATLISYTIGMCFIYINSKKIMLKM